MLIFKLIEILYRIKDTVNYIFLTPVNFFPLHLTVDFLQESTKSYKRTRPTLQPSISKKRKSQRDA